MTHRFFILVVVRDIEDPLPNTKYYIFEMYLRQEVGGIVVFD